MARSESTGLQVALILLFMLTVALGVSTVLLYGEMGKAVKLQAAAESERDQSRDAMESMSFQLQYLMHIVGARTMTEEELKGVIPGVEGDDVMAAVHRKYETDMETYRDGSETNAPKNYPDLPFKILQRLQAANVQNTDLQITTQRLSSEKDTLKKQAEDTITKANEDVKQAKDDYLASMDAFNAALDKTKADQATQLTSFNTARDQLSSQLTTRTNEVSSLQADVKARDNVIDSQKVRITELLDEPFETADGRVTWVNQATGKLWINLGLADGLRRQTTFSVYDQNALNVAPGQRRKPGQDEEETGRKIDDRKGKIEITRVIDQHLAEARIVEDSAADPILPGDQVFSPAWKPGRKIRFALVGFMDLDGDGRSNRDQVRNLITMNGGVIDAEVHDDGATEGKLTTSTTYLVRGEEPQDRSDKVLNPYSTLIKEAGDLGIREINLPTLLNLMGYKAEVQTIGLGGSAVPEQFQPRVPEGKARTSTGNVSPLHSDPKQ